MKNYKITKKELESIENFFKEEKIFTTNVFINWKTISSFILLMATCCFAYLYSKNTKSTLFFVFFAICIILYFIYFLIVILYIAKFSIDDYKRTYKNTVTDFFKKKDIQDKFYSDCFLSLYSRDKECIEDYNNNLIEHINKSNKRNEKFFNGIQITGPLVFIYAFVEFLNKIKVDSINSEYDIILLVIPFIFYFVFVIESYKIYKLEKIQKAIADSIEFYDKEGIPSGDNKI